MSNSYRDFDSSGPDGKPSCFLIVFFYFIYPVNTVPYMGRFVTFSCNAYTHLYTYVIIVLSGIICVFSFIQKIFRPFSLSMLVLKIFIYWCFQKISKTFTFRHSTLYSLLYLLIQIDDIIYYIILQVIFSSN